MTTSFGEISKPPRTDTRFDLDPRDGRASAPDVPEQEGVKYAMLLQDRFSRLLAGSITLTFFLYVFINMAMVSGLVPVIGLPLPLISRGGTSVVTLFVGFGLLMSIQTHDRKLNS